MITKRKAIPNETVNNATATEKQIKLKFSLKITILHMNLQTCLLGFNFKIPKMPVSEDLCNFSGLKLFS